MSNHEALTLVSSPRRRPWLRLIRNGALGLVAVMFVVWLILFVTKGRFLKHRFETVVSRVINRQVHVAGDFQLYFSPITIKFYAEGLTIGNAPWTRQSSLFSAQRIDTRIAPLSLIFGKRHLYWLDLKGASIDLEWDKAHDRNSWTFDGTKGGAPLNLPRIDRVSVSGTKIRYADPKMQLLANLDIDPVRSTGARIERAVGLTGAGQFRETPFRLTAQLLSPNDTLTRGKNALSLRAWAANSVIDVNATLPSIVEIENVPLDTRAHGRDLSELLAIIGVAIPKTRTYALAARLVKNGDIYQFTNLHGKFGQSDVAGHLTIAASERLRLQSALITKQLDIIDAAPFIGYNPDIVATKGAVAAAAATGAAPRRILPDATLPVATMQRFDADLKWQIKTVRSHNVPISNIDLSLALDRGKLALSPLSFDMARGHVAADIVLDTRERPAADSYDIRLSPTPMGRLLAGYGVVEAGTSGTIKGRMRLSGRGDTLHDSLASASGRVAFIMPQGSLWTRNIQLSELDLGTFAYKMFQGRLKEPVQLNCGLIGFTVRDGIAVADPILIDTRKNVITGRGGFSFRDESLDIAIKADGKKFSLFSGQSPVGLGGNFSNPSINVVSPQLLARAGAGIGLIALATPLAGILAFVDIGDAKSAACGPILAGAGAAAQRTLHGKKRDDVGAGKSNKP